MDWKEKFDKKYGWDLQFVQSRGFADKEVKDFISTEIIEKLIEDIPDTFTTYDENANETHHKAFQSQLRNKWL